MVLAALAQNGLALEFASSRLQADPLIVEAAVKMDGDALALAWKGLRGARHGRGVVRTAVSQKGRALVHASVELQDDHEIVNTAVAQDGTALLHASDRLKDDRETVATAVGQEGSALMYASVTLRKDPALAALAQGRGGDNVVFSRPQELFQRKRVLKRPPKNRRHPQELPRTMLAHQESEHCTVLNKFDLHHEPAMHTPNSAWQPTEIPAHLMNTHH